MTSLRSEIASTCVLSAILSSMGATAGIATSASHRPEPIKIRFITGAISAQVRGYLNPRNGDRALFTVDAHAGNRMLVNIIPRTPEFMTGGTVRSPSGRQAGEHGGLIYDQTLQETGTYRISVEPNLMGSLRRSGAFILEVVILPTRVVTGR